MRELLQTLLAFRGWGRILAAVLMRLALVAAVGVLVVILLSAVLIGGAGMLAAAVYLAFEPLIGAAGAAAVTGALLLLALALVFLLVIRGMQRPQMTPRGRAMQMVGALPAAEWVRAKPLEALGSTFTLGLLMGHGNSLAARELMVLMTRQAATSDPTPEQRLEGDDKAGLHS